MTDQLRADGIGCVGGWARTPQLESLAREGMLFTGCVTTSPVCVPARLTFATGQYPHNTGIWQNCPHVLAPEQGTWMQAVRAAGYRTSLFGKTHLHPTSGDLREVEHELHAYGWDDVDEIPGPRAAANCWSHMTARWEAKGFWKAYREDYAERFANKPWVARPSPLPLEEFADVYVGQRAKEYLQAYDGEEPWCCTVSFGGPHEPWDTPEAYAARYEPAGMPAPRTFPEDRGERPRGRLDAMRERAPNPSPQEIAAMRANYAANVELIDAQIGEILEVIRARGEWEQTAVLFTSDHGELNGDAGMIYKSNFLGGAVEVPMIARFPDMPEAVRGTRNSTPVEWHDAGATLVELAGATLGHTQFARSLMPVLRGEASRVRHYAISELCGEVCIQTEGWRMALNNEGRPYLLLDRVNDPEETVNLAGSAEHVDVRRELSARVLEFFVQTQVHFHPTPR